MYSSPEPAGALLTEDATWIELAYLARFLPPVVTEDITVLLIGFVNIDCCLLCAG